MIQGLSPSEMAATSLEAISHGFELLLTYVPLGFAIAMVTGRRQAMWIAVAATVLAAAPVVYLQGWIVGRDRDVIDVAVAALGAAIGVWVAGAGAVEFCRARESGGEPVQGLR